MTLDELRARIAVLKQRLLLGWGVAEFDEVLACTRELAERETALKYIEMLALNQCGHPKHESFKIDTYVLRQGGGASDLLNQEHECFGCLRERRLLAASSAKCMCCGGTQGSFVVYHKDCICSVLVPPLVPCTAPCCRREEQGPVE